MNSMIIPILGKGSTKQQDPKLFYLLGKARNVIPDYDPKAQELLSLAVKTDPTLVEAWNELGKFSWYLKSQNKIILM